MSTVLGSIITSPDTCIRDLNIISDDQRDQIWLWNQTVPPPVQHCPHDWIIEQANKQPNVQAVSAWDGDLTYSELDSLSTTLAHRLLGLGIGPTSLVPLCFEKSKWVSVAILAVLKTGGAFLMINPTHPEPRLHSIIEQTRATTVLCSKSSMLLSSRLVDCPVVIGADLVENNDTNTLLPQVDPSSPMYIVFTSGSTGVPKGVVVSHTAFATSIIHQSEKLGYKSSSRVYDFVNHIFDVFVHYTVITLVKGGCLCVPSETDRSNSLMTSLIDAKPTHVSLTPSTARLVDPTKVPSIETCIFLGEPCNINDTQKWWGHVKLINAYGPSECTPLSTIKDNAKNMEAVTRIGKGAGAVTWIVDPVDHNKLLPIGMAGELLLEGPLLGLGYLNDPEKTTAAFIQDPAWLLAGSTAQHSGRSGTLYKTGDLVRYSEDGDLTFVGRKDTQVKINGQRIELAEVEHWIEICMPGTSAAVAEVIIPLGKNPVPVLAVFCSLVHKATAEDESELAAVKIMSISSDILKELAAHLPSYMLPTLFFSMREMPMTTTGKMDRKRLREIGESFSVTQLAELRTADLGPKQQPGSALEQSIQKIWSQVLNMESSKIGPNDNFFYLGGDSISAMQVVAEARKVGMKLAVSSLFRHPTLHALTQQCIPAIDDSPGETAPFAVLGKNVPVSSFLQDVSAHHGLASANIRDAYPCTPLQEALMSSTLKHPGNNILQNTLELSPGVAIKTLKAAWETVHRAMPILRTRLVQHGSLGLTQIVVDEDISWTDAAGLDQYLKSDREQSMTLGQPLVRYALVRDDTGSVRWLVWTAHHVLYDGRTLTLLMDALKRAYEGKSVRVGPQFQAYIKYMREQDSRRMSDFWQKMLAGYESVPFPPLPPTFDRPVDYKMIEYQFSSDSQQSSSRDVTTSILFRAAWAIVAGHMSNSNDVAFGATVTGRNAPVANIDVLVGQTSARVPVRIKLARDQNVSQYLKDIQQQATDMMPFEQTGLRQIATISPECQKACMFQALLVVQPSETRSADDVFGKWDVGDQSKWFIAYALKLDVQLGGAPRIFTTFDTRVLKLSTVNQLLRRLESVVWQLGSANAEMVLAQIDVTLPLDVEQTHR
jgi:amino acid adenylation domain-containing protein